MIFFWILPEKTWILGKNSIKRNLIITNIQHEVFTCSDRQYAWFTLPLKKHPVPRICPSHPPAYILPSASFQVHFTPYKMTDCTMCNRPNAQPCVVCGSARYCSTQCREDDRPIHNLLCDAYTKHIDRPGPNYKRAIIFHSHKLSPEFVWYEVVARFKHDKRRLETAWDEDPCVKEILSAPGNSRLVFHLFCENILRHRWLGHSLGIMHRNLPRGADEDLTPNQGIMALTKGTMNPFWKGSAVILKTRSVEVLPSYYQDVNMVDFRDAVDFFLSFNNDVANVPEMAIRMSTPRSAICVLVRTSEHVRTGYDAYQPYFFFREEPAFNRTITSLISQFVELPVRVIMNPPGQFDIRPPFEPVSHEKGFRLVAPDNQPGVCLHLLDPNHPELWLGLDPEHPEDRSMLVVREDKKAINLHQVEALCRYAQMKAQPLLKMPWEGGKTREDILATVSRADFLEWCKDKQFGSERLGFKLDFQSGIIRGQLS